MPSRTARSSSINSIPSVSRPASWGTGIPSPLRPLVRAYLLGYGFTVGPRVLALLAHHAALLLRASTGRALDDAAAHGEPRPPPLRKALARILKAGLKVDRFATFCAALVGGSTLLEVCHHAGAGVGFVRSSVVAVG